MKFTTIIKSLALAIILVSSFVFVACTPAQQQILEGVLKNIDSVNGTITITDNNGQTHVINIQSGSQVQTQSGNSSIEALEPGTTVKIELQSGNVTRKVEADLARVQGAISQVNAATNEITITPTKGGQTVTVSITSDTKIKLSNGNTGSFSNLTTGARVDVRYSTDTKAAFMVNVGQTETSELEGTVTGISGNSITIEASKKRSLTLTTDNSTVIQVGGSTGTIADLQNGTRVHAKFDPFTNIAATIQVQGPGQEQGQGQENRTANRTVPTVLNNFTAHLSGGEEVPPVNTRGQGEAIFQLSDNGTVLSFRLNVANTDNIQMAHIHIGAKGQSGPIAAWLYPSAPPAVTIPGRFDGTLASGNITAANLIGPLQGQPLSALIDQIKSGNAYVNVHTSQHPDGEIRGQISQGEGNSASIPGQGNSEQGNSAGKPGERNKGGEDK